MRGRGEGGYDSLERFDPDAIGHHLARPASEFRSLHERMMQAQFLTPQGLWDQTKSASPSVSALMTDLSCDVAIIGGGFCGLSAALHLAEIGVDAVMLEAETPGWGASGRNGGQVIAGLKLDPRE